MSAIAIVIYLSVCVGIILALRERIKEIGNEELAENGEPKNFDFVEEFKKIQNADG